MAASSQSSIGSGSLVDLSDGLDADYEYHGPEEPMSSPALKSIFVFWINPVATLNALLRPELTDAEIAMVESLLVNIYVGFLNRIYGLPFDDDPFLECDLYFVSQGGLQPTDHHRLIEFPMGVPIWPTTEHPLGREPITLTNSLPWPNCYLNTTISAHLRILAAEFFKSNIPARMPLSQSSHLRSLHWEDLERHKTLSESRAVQVPKVTEQFNDRPALQTMSTDEEQLRYESNDSQDDIGDILLAMMTTNTRDSKLPMVDASYDLSLLTEVPDPRGYFEDKKALQSLHAEILRRRAAIEAEEDIRWAQERKEDEECQIAAAAAAATTSHGVSPKKTRSFLGSRRLRNISKQLQQLFARRTSADSRGDIASVRKNGKSPLHHSLASGSMTDSIPRFQTLDVLQAYTRLVS
ncbi:hypothetical protein JAAARDRAFT_190664 [Jaapia argillacea MUCL 33604]|uniref:Uncharacterized protein n=1 Tax=Jaapia argillacea MUCL 33604 TaxID=933084 RepID=A0A067Q4J2_9AGAM|nr:hypothetical protein JAAARDRAFT_190664 [Jaapia argillacea MUCL 33604]